MYQKLNALSLNMTKLNIVGGEGVIKGISGKKLIVNDRQPASHIGVARWRQPGYRRVSRIFFCLF